ncbi:histidine phosphatase family protein [Lactobacillus sp. ESL0701]|uniref:histidine phosphatase family protein n=1 Tax=Lactobacillus sp. ESL0701 TaxID=2983217 RepID=UPI0023F719CB|nr:histidine phosphatase family protein [Lactobacillus sp. ESL0701]MDF7672603.1 histidine phosphatase family protein [Lactobacillus sp. ESL0701]
MLNVYIVRHGETDTNKMGAINGSSVDLPLNQTGIKQVETLRDSFDINQIDYVYASPLKRAQQTAKILAQDKREIITDKRLTEMNYGNWDGKDTQEIRDKYPQVFDELGYFKENYSDYSTGESYQELGARLMDFWHDLIQQHENEAVLLVFHGTASRSMVQNILEIPNIALIGEIQNAGVINFSVDDRSKKAYLRYYNRVAPGKFFLKK